MKELFLQPKEHDVIRTIKETDEYMRVRFPIDQPYLYTAGGNPIVFHNPVGFIIIPSG
jgi:hypothetical protein